MINSLFVDETKEIETFKVFILILKFFLLCLSLKFLISFMVSFYMKSVLYFPTKSAKHRSHQCL